MQKSLPICQLGRSAQEDLSLRGAAVPVVDIHDPLIQQLIDDAIATIKAANGVGIAAPQLGHALRLFIVASRPNPRYPEAPTMEPTAMINPVILAKSNNMVSDWEGCLSLPDRRAQVLRHQSIEVTYLDRYGNRYHQELTDFIARIFQHEYDHLEGIVFSDRLVDESELITEADYLQQISVSIA
ncbi:Peptide deformylase [Thalassoporum mexicanum PCC 7367]|uniref:peptide deformylase n=1 Tax=Thalassoporum mexicanum TaxID=3457544 RepID=UPI00029FE376|nr:peptide deformylase [Pseudanabaena sp. PCC 7367]AFY70736.1 Peptide deformylase [Pseudanabaena sp. PCC 7367]